MIKFLWDKWIYISLLSIIGILANYDFQGCITIIQVLITTAVAIAIVYYWGQWYPMPEEYSYQVTLLNFNVIYLFVISITGILIGIIISNKLHYTNLELNVYRVLFYTFFCFIFLYILDRSRYGINSE